MTTNTFREAYGVLQRHAETLRNQREPNIDDLLTIVTESVDAYKVCQVRIAAVEKALEQALGGAGAEPGGSGAADAVGDGTRPAPAGAGDDDIPF
jgi:exodeoxyribonuclease VII small subunit